MCQLSTKRKNCVSAVGTRLFQWTSVSTVTVNCGDFQLGETFPCLCCSAGSFPWGVWGEEKVERGGDMGGLGGGGGVLGD